MNSDNTVLFCVGCFEKEDRGAADRASVDYVILINIIYITLTNFVKSSLLLQHENTQKKERLLAPRSMTGYLRFY
ncbi:hypothetical protein A359_08410 [secondary endosymbiont of Ctenarytaina eucalypti]|uniref:Uncharacterized protein n=1 Tax=secondary endosymbiont of Ctenarytaina eucalypti TaxID=1199245 RepID=J3TFV8_9ENTR|nr:hypothetical protein A359_08410 [secondary endosymbiont of Ctenarytaina eucalypti]